MSGWGVSGCVEEGRGEGLEGKGDFGEGNKLTICLFIMPSISP